MSVEPREIICVLGPRSSGVSTLANMQAHFMAHRLGMTVKLVTHDIRQQPADLVAGEMLVFRVRPLEMEEWSDRRHYDALVCDGFVPKIGWPMRIITTSGIPHDART